MYANEQQMYGNDTIGKMNIKPCCHYYPYWFWKRKTWLPIYLSLK